MAPPPFPGVTEFGSPIVGVIPGVVPGGTELAGVILVSPGTVSGIIGPAPPVEGSVVPGGITGVKPLLGTGFDGITLPVEGVPGTPLEWLGFITAGGLAAKTGFANVLSDSRAQNAVAILCLLIEF